MGSISKLVKSGIKDAEIKEDNLATGAATTAKFGPNAVESSEINNGTVTASDLASTLDLSSKTVTLPSSTVNFDREHFNVSLLGFKMAVNESLTVFNLVDGIVDEFHDESGTDEAEGSNDTYCATNDFYINGTSQPQAYVASFAAHVDNPISEPDTSTAGTYAERSSFPHPSYTGFEEGSLATYTVPTNVTGITAHLWGAGGASGRNGPGAKMKPGGAGGYTTSCVAVTPGQVLGVIVGVGGGEGYSPNPNPLNGEGGYGGHHPGDPSAAVNEKRGGGDGSGQSAGGGGAGLTAIFSGTSEGLEPSNVPNVVLIAGGGGGASACNGGIGAGGLGGGPVGYGSVSNPSPQVGPSQSFFGLAQTNQCNNGGGGGDQEQGGQAGSSAQSGGLFYGGNSSPNGGGGGAGYYGGGGGGSGHGGGGGSGYVGHPQVSSSSSSVGVGINGIGSGDAPQALTPQAPHPGWGCYHGTQLSASGSNAAYTAYSKVAPSPVADANAFVTRAEMANGTPLIANGTGVASINDSPPYPNPQGALAQGYWSQPGIESSDYQKIGGWGHGGASASMYSNSAGGGGFVILTANDPTGTTSSTTIVSNAFPANSVPTSSRIVVFEENVATPTINTDIIASISRDGGSNYTTATLSDSGYVTGSSGQRILTGQATISGQPSGQSMRWKLALANNQVKIHGVSLSWA